MDPQRLRWIWPSSRAAGSTRPPATSSSSSSRSSAGKVQGRWAGQPLILLEWQRDFVMRLFGWKRPDGLTTVQAGLPRSRQEERQVDHDLRPLPCPALDRRRGIPAGVPQRLRQGASLDRLRRSQAHGREESGAGQAARDHRLAEDDHPRRRRRQDRGQLRRGGQAGRAQSQSASSSTSCIARRTRRCGRSSSTPRSPESSPSRSHHHGRRGRGGRLVGAARVLGEGQRRRDPRHDPPGRDLSGTPRPTTSTTRPPGARPIRRLGDTIKEEDFARELAEAKLDPARARQFQATSGSTSSAGARPSSSTSTIWDIGNVPVIIIPQAPALCGPRPLRDPGPHRAGDPLRGRTTGST